MEWWRIVLFIVMIVGFVFLFIVIPLLSNKHEDELIEKEDCNRILKHYSYIVISDGTEHKVYAYSNVEYNPGDILYVDTLDDIIRVKTCEKLFYNSPKDNNLHLSESVFDIKEVYDNRYHFYSKGNGSNELDYIRSIEPLKEDKIYKIKYSEDTISLKDGYIERNIEDILNRKGVIELHKYPEVNSHLACIVAKVRFYDSMNHYDYYYIDEKVPSYTTVLVETRNGDTEADIISFKEYGECEEMPYMYENIKRIKGIVRRPEKSKKHAKESSHGSDD